MSFEIVCFDINLLKEEHFKLFKAVVSKERKEQSERFVFEKDAKRCICAGVLLQYSFFKYTGRISMPTIKFNQFQKPIVDEEFKFCFNLTHSGNWLGIAWGEKNVGLDIEIVDEKNDCPINYFLTIAEQKYLDGISDDEKKKRIIRLWTIKEAYLKWLGTGMSTDMKSFSVETEYMWAEYWKGNIEGNTTWISFPIERDSYLAICGVENCPKCSFVTVDELVQFAILIDELSDKKE